jgi:hypothetical protein
MRFEWRLYLLYVIYLIRFSPNYYGCYAYRGVRGGSFGLGTTIQPGRWRVRFPTVSLEFFHWHNPSGRTIALGLTHTLTEMSIRNISWGSKGGRCLGLNTLPYSCVDCLEIWERQPFWNPQSLSRSVIGLFYLLAFYACRSHHNLLVLINK